MIIYVAILCLIVILFLVYKLHFKEGLTQINQNANNILDSSCNGNLSIDISGVTTCYDVNNILYPDINLNNKSNQMCTIKSTAPWSIELYNEQDYEGDGLIISSNSTIEVPCNFKSLQQVKDDDTINPVSNMLEPTDDLSFPLSPYVFANVAEYT